MDDDEKMGEDKEIPTIRRLVLRIRSTRKRVQLQALTFQADVK